VVRAASGSNSGYRGVTFKPKERSSKKYELRVVPGGKQNFLGLFATAEEAALARARHLRDTTARLLEQPPQQAPPQGAAGPSEASSYEEVEDGFDPADIAAAVSLAALRPAAFRERAEGGEAAGARSGAGGEGGEGGGGGGGGGGAGGGGYCPAMRRRGGGGGRGGER